MVRFGVLDSPLSYIAIAAVGPAVTTIAEAPAALFEGTAMSMAAAIGYALWRCANVASRFLENSEKHRVLEVAQWKAADEHRTAERAMWTSD